MAIFKKNVLFKLFYPIIILSLLTFSCTTDNSITSTESIGKTNEVFDINTPITGDGDNVDIEDYVPYWLPPDRRKDFLQYIKSGGSENCYFLQWVVYAQNPETPKNKTTLIEDAYHFRDDFLLKSKKGFDYICSYYLLSNYGIDNNLVMKHSLEHLSLMNLGIEASQELQHGTNNNQILINRSTYDNLKDIVKIYRDSENHQDIDPVLDYLDTDLEKYYNKTKAEIATDFGF
ncbi:MAG: hypothetical protein GWP19_01715 [Planctomycetia bacterium]|nr:hypothetical protein [Planctomycetia bacterium]